MFFMLTCRMPFHAFPFCGWIFVSFHVIPLPHVPSDDPFNYPVASGAFHGDDGRRRKAFAWDTPAGCGAQKKSWKFQTWEIDQVIEITAPCRGHLDKSLSWNSEDGTTAPAQSQVNCSGKTRLRESKKWFRDQKHPRGIQKIFIRDQKLVPSRNCAGDVYFCPLKDQKELFRSIRQQGKSLIFRASA